MNWTKIKFLLSLLGVSLIMSTTVCSCVSNTIATPQITDTIQTPETDEKTTSTPTLSIKKGNLPFTPGITPTFETFEEINLYNNDMLIFVTDFFTQQNFILNLKNNIIKLVTI